MQDQEIDITPDWNSLAHYEPDFHGGAIISPDGSETPITENMIQVAFNILLDEDNSGRGGNSGDAKKLSEKRPAQHTAQPNEPKKSIFV